MNYDEKIWTERLPMCVKCLSLMTPDIQRISKGYILKKCLRCWYDENRDDIINNTKSWVKNNRSDFKKYQKSYNSRPEVILKNSVRKLLREKVKTGKIKRLPCEVCGKNPSQAHHTDYSKPYKVQWLCSKHHGECHRKVVK